MNNNAKKKSKVTCGMCGRVDYHDLGRRFCPVTIQNISFERDAEKCRFFIPRDSEESKVRKGKKE